MQTLFPVAPVVPEGFLYLPDFLNDAEEEQLCRVISRLNLHTFNFQGYEARRKVASFGYDWNFDTRHLTRGKEIPLEFSDLIEKVAERFSLATKEIGELLVTDYPPGAVINWHRDAPPFDKVVGISLLSDCLFRFRPNDKTKQTRKATISLPVERRSVYLMSGPSRTAWQHSIAPVQHLRYSITLRTLL
ncbi:alpha-ketoglutarate-dependent dioxygenase AlkB [Segetibacter sp. 3557_3]|uniref:alpha-ketoglutarate-dependent dioxygenase AlkB n=1 Tax=Segetibacter sp. 3557_3 TaxID=2547429 RepID=UPI001404B103|nr:alpha-ketoglutarate-dependent dioxygenase AlkB [Segetibacter sp. 3557_3]